MKTIASLLDSKSFRLAAAGTQTLFAGLPLGVAFSKIASATGILLILFGAYARAGTYTFNTSDAPFTPGVDNQGWWPASGLANGDINDNYYTGWSVLHNRELRSFFTFHLGNIPIRESVVSARLELTQYSNAGTLPGGSTEKVLGLFHVAADVATVNNNSSLNTAIFDDLGDGPSYDIFSTTSTITSNVLSIPLNATALSDIQAARGNFFTIGGRLLNLQTGGEDFAIFSGSGSNGTQRLIVETESLDPSFSGDGIQITPFMDGATVRPAEARGMLVQPDGKLVVTGLVSNGSDNDFGLVRYLPDGSLDPTFGVAGKTTLNFLTHEGAYAAALQPDGKILVAGDAFNGTWYDFAIARFNADGTPDTTFDGDGKVTTSLSSGNEGIAAMVLQPDGKIVVAGNAVVGGQLDTAVARYMPDGTLDPSFDGDGWRIIPLSAVTEDQATSLALQADGKIFLAGWKYVGGVRNSVLTRLTGSGSTDPTFGYNGVVEIDFASDDGLRSVAVQPDGKVVACGFATAGGSYDMSFVRLLENGALDTSFDSDGKRTAAMGTGYDDARDLVIQADGKIVSVGFTNNGTIDDMAVLRLNSDGSLDATFDGDGKLVLAPGPGHDRLFAVALQPDGDIVAAGMSENAGNVSQFAVVRLIGIPLPGVWNLAGVQSSGGGNLQITGQIDPAGSNTTVTVEYGTTVALGSSLSLGTFTGNGLQAFNGTLYPGGLTLGATYYYRIVATNANGTTTGSIQSLVYAPGARDLTFSGDGMQITPFIAGSVVRTSDFRAVAVQPDSKIVAVGFANNGSNDDCAIARYHPDGTLDNSFATGGLATMAIGPTVDQFYAVALQADGKIVAAGLSWNGSRFVFALARFLSNGSLDPNFDGDGVATFAPGTGDAQARGLLIQSDGKIVACGYATVSGNVDAAFVRLLPNGALDTSFSGDGLFTTPIATGYDCANDIAQLPDGKLVAALQCYTSSVGDFGLLRLNTNGTLDTTFDGDGKLLTDYIGSEDYAAAIVIQPDGKIVTGGAVHFGGSNYDFASIRYHPNGTLDNSFHGDGKVSISFGPGHDDIRDIVLQPDGKIVCVGNTNNGSNVDMAVARLNPDGSLDATFDGDGRAVLVPGSGGDLLFGAALAPSGEIVGVGISENSSFVAQFAVVRLLGGPNDLLVNGGFEANEALGGGMPTGFGDWRNEQASTVTTVENGVTPYQGMRMLKFLGTDIAGGSTDNACAVVQYVPMSRYATEITAGTGVRVEVTGRFNRVSATDSEIRIELVGYNGTPSNPGIVTTTRSQALITDGDPSTWELFGNYIDLPLGTTMVAVFLTAVENITNNPSSPEFDGNYADGIQLTVRTDFTAPTLSPVSISSNNLNTAWAKTGDIVTVSFTANEPIQTPVVTLLGTAATVANTSGNDWTATATVGAGTAEGVATFSITAVDLIGNAAPAVTATTDASGVTVDHTSPDLTPPGNSIVGATSVAGATVNFSVGASDNLDPAPMLSVHPASGSLFPIGVTMVNLSLTDGAGHVSTGSFAVTVQDQTSAPNFANAGTVPLTADGFDATGFTVGTVMLGFDPAPGQVLTLVNNTSANPIVGAFTNLPDGGTIATNQSGRDLLFIANYSGGDGDGNDLTLTLLNPEIVVEEPLLTDIADGGSKSFGTMVLGSPVSLVFTIRNTGPGILNGLTITQSGTDQTAFTVTASPTAPVTGPAGTTTFTVQFNPITSGAKTAAIHIASDDADENPFDITLTGRALSISDDTDMDGLNDVAEYNMRDLGFIWNDPQPGLVDIYKANANVAGYYSPSQVQALHVGTPLIQRNPATGQFKLTIGLKKSTDLSQFSLYPFTAPQTSVNGDGKIEFLFSSPDDAAFFRLGVE